MTKQFTILTALLAALFATLASAPLTRADIFQWEYIDPANPSLGRQQSTMLAPDGTGLSALPGANLSNRNLTMAYLVGASLRPNVLSYDEYGYPLDYIRSNLTGTNLAQADLTHASFLGAVLTGASFSDADVRGAFIGSYDGFFNYGGTGITPAQLYATASYQARDLTGIALTGVDFSNANLAHQNLTGAYLAASDMTGANLTQTNFTNADFDGASLSGADLTDAEVRGARFVGIGLTLAQLYSTASYKVRDLSGINVQGSAALTGVNLVGVNLTDANFQGATLTSANLTSANLTNANFSGNMFYWGGANLSGANLSHANLANASFAGNEDSPGADLTAADLTGADVRGANFYRSRLEGATTTNLIQSDGHIEGLNLASGDLLIVRDYDGNPSAIIPVDPLPIVVDQQLSMNSGGTLRLEFDADAWSSTISFAPGISVILAGDLQLTFAPGVDVAAQVGRTFDLFDWSGVAPTGTFAVESPYVWDLANLYTTGEVKLLTIPGPPGDYNQNGVVDAADYTVWRDGLGTIYTQSHYDIWRANFGASLGSASGAARHSAGQVSGAIPEPANIVLLVVGATIGSCRVIHRCVARP